MLGGSLCPSGTLSHGKGCLSSTVWDIFSVCLGLHFLSPGHLLPRFPLFSAPFGSFLASPYVLLSKSCNSSLPSWASMSLEFSGGIPICYPALSLSLGTYENHPSGGALFFDPFSFLLRLRDFLQASLSYCKQLGPSITQWPKLAHSIFSSVMW